MRYPAVARPAIVRVVSAVTLLLTTACQTWQPRPQSPTVVIQQEQPDRVRLYSIEEESWLVLREPRVLGDSIAGRLEVHDRLPRSRPEWRSEPKPPELVPIEIPAASVGRTEVRGTDPAATAALVLGALAVAALVGGMIVLESWDGLN